MEKYKCNAIVVLSYTINLDGSPTEEAKKRVEKAVYLYKKKISPLIIMTGFKNPSDINAVITEAESMKRYAQTLGVNKKNIVLETKSRDTVGHAFFLKKYFKQRKWKKIAVVTTKYHVRRSKKIFDFILGKDYKIFYYGAPNPKNLVQKIEKEKKSTAFFEGFFDGIKRGDDVAISKRMKKHKLYNKL